MRRPGLLLSWLSLCLLAALGCLGPSLAPRPEGEGFRPGQYVREYFAAPDFNPTTGRYHLAAIRVHRVQGVRPENVPQLFAAAVSQALKDNGLTVAAAGAEYEITLVCERLAVSQAFRRLRGRISATLALSGTINREGRRMFAFRDALHLTSPLAPGPPAPQETELLLEQLSQEAARRLVNQILLYRFSDSPRSANTRSVSRGRFS